MSSSNDGQAPAREVSDAVREESVVSSRCVGGSGHAYNSLLKPAGGGA